MPCASRDCAREAFLSRRRDIVSEAGGTDSDLETDAGKSSVNMNNTKNTSVFLRASVLGVQSFIATLALCIAIAIFLLRRTRV